MDAALRRQARQRAAERCEYCHLSQLALSARFHVEHIVAKQHRGADELSNLALACPFCNRFKGPNLSAIDPQTNQVVPIFHPRHDRWEDHFETSGITIVGLTPTGRATVLLLEMNDDNRLQIRGALQESGEWP